MASPVPRAARPFQRSFISNVRLIWGLNAPTAVMAGQVQKESSWQPLAQNPIASGIAQFTTPTAAWLVRAYPALGAAQPFEPEWSFRALAQYDLFLYGHQASAATSCSRWAFTLVGYNGGEGWVQRDQQLTAAKGADRTKWWGNVERFSTRSQAAFIESRAYPRDILLRYQQLFTSWGPGVTCP